MNIDLNDFYKEMLDKIMEDTRLDPEDTIKFLISFYYKSQINEAK